MKYIHAPFPTNPRKQGRLRSSDHIINLTDAPDLPICFREKHLQPKQSQVSKTELANTCSANATQAIQAKLNAWRDDPRMVFLAQSGRDLTAKERKEWERNIHNYQHRYN